MEHWRQFANPPLAGALEKYQGGLSHDYDWRLNGVDLKPWIYYRREPMISRSAIEPKGDLSNRDFR